MSTTERRNSVSSAGQQASRFSILGKKPISSLHDLLTATKEDVAAALTTQGQSVSRASLTLSALQLQYLKSQDVDPSAALTSLVSTTVHEAYRQVAEEAVVLETTLKSHQQKMAELTEQLEKQTLLLQQNHAGNGQIQGLRLSQCNRELDTLKSRIADLNSAVPAADCDGQPTSQEQTEPTLRLTGLSEEEDETDAELLHKVQSVLDHLPRSVCAEAAKRQGRYGGRKARAVIITFASVQDRLGTLRAKAALNKQESTKGYSIHEILSPEEQMQKNAMWQTFLQARKDRRRASFRGCNLYVDGQLVLGPLQTETPVWDFQQVPMPGCSFRYSTDRL
ncbi:hypothetical protein WJX74_007453 [Apatococcus lobatus]|uniref:Uncharacterized protein n=1 Tax=Apatococcus lobatus TaxID=904363 RepID=A0AAW1Q6N4_9CHLO